MVQMDNTTSNNSDESNNRVYCWHIWRIATWCYCCSHCELCCKRACNCYRCKHINDDAINKSIIIRILDNRKDESKRNK